MQASLDLVDGHHAGPLFIIVKERELARPKGKEGATYRRMVRRRTPAWADHKAIAAVYRQARCLSAMTGERYVVDHIVPLVGGIVNGLHVHWNLRVIHWLENAQKGAFWWPDMPEYQTHLFD